MRMIEAPGSRYVIPRQVAVMTTNLHGIHTIVQERDREPQSKGTQASRAMYKHLNAALSR